MIPIEVEHPEYAARKATWLSYRHLYAGGEELKANAARYLTPRHREPADVYQERLSRLFYENYIGSIIDWYAATLFRREPVLAFEGSNRAARQFFNEFTEDCDLRGSSLTQFFRQQFVDALVYGASYIVADFPRVRTGVSNRAQEDAAGASRAFLAGYNPTDIINWSRDEYGNFEFVTIRSKALRANPQQTGWYEETRWIRYDRQEYAVYRAADEGEGSNVPALVDRGAHGFAGARAVPVFELRTSDGLWLMNKAALLQLEHLNKSNALAWALTMGLFAMPVIYSDREWNQMVGESYYIQLAPADRFGWTEPEGHVYQIAAENLMRLKDEIYRVCYLLAQAGGPFSYSAQSGLSKQRDFAITQEVLRGYGDVVKDTAKRVLRAICAARQDGLEIDVSGLDEFDVGDLGAELEDAQRLLQLGAESPTLKRQMFKKLAFKYLCDVRQDVKDAISKEIDDAVRDQAE